MLIGVSSSIALAIFTCAKDVVSKKLSTTLPGVVSALASFIFAMPYYAILLPVLWLIGVEDFAIAPAFFGLIVLRALSDTGAEWSKMESLGRADLSLVSAFQSLSPAFLAIISPLITGDPLSIFGVLGLLIISVAGTLLAEPWKAKRSELAGILFGIACAFFFSINHSLDRLAAQTASAPLSAFAMTLLAGLFVLPFAIRMQGNFVGKLTLLQGPLLLRGLFETLGMIAKLLALQYLSAPTVVGIARLAVPISILTGALYLKEPALKRRLVMGVIMVIGSALTLMS